MSRKDANHIWLDDVGGPRARGSRGLFFGRRRLETKMQVRIFADGTTGPPQHTDVFMTEAQARELALWLVENLTWSKS